MGSQQTALTQYDIARNALDRARTLDEVKTIADKTDAMRHYARQAKDPDMEIWLAEIRVRALRRIGEISKKLNTTQGRRADITSSQHRDEVGKREALRDAGISKDQAHRCEKIAQLPASDLNALFDEKRKQKLPVTVDEILAKVQQREARSEAKGNLERLENLESTAPTGVYDVIVIDPPWPMQKIERKERPHQAAFGYPTMTEAELEAHDVPCADDCHVWLWTTQRFLPMAFRLLKVWDLKYVCTFVWHKPGGFQPVGLPQFNCEFALYARRGAPKFFDTKAFPTCFEAPRGEHSEKPEEFYKMVRGATAGRRLDMFNRREIEGFRGSGKEAK